MMIIIQIVLNIIFNKILILIIQFVVYYYYKILHFLVWVYNKKNFKWYSKKKLNSFLLQTYLV